MVNTNAELNSPGNLCGTASMDLNEFRRQIAGLLLFTVDTSKHLEAEHDILTVTLQTVALVMDIAGLAIAVFNEAFEIGMFITQTIMDAAHQDKDFRKLEFEFTHQQTILTTFGKRFIESKLIYSLDDCWVVQIKRILEELRKVVGEYARLAAKYEESYRKMMRSLEEWWKVGANEQSGKQVDRKNLRLEAVSIPEPTKSSKSSLGFRDRLSRKLTQLEWALFDRKKLEEVVKDQKGWTDKLVEIMKLTLLPLPRYSDNASHLQELSEDAKILGFSKLTKTRLLILDPSSGKQATEIDAKSISQRIVRPPGPHTKRSIAQQLLNANLDGSEILVEYKKYMRNNPQMVLEITTQRIRFLSRLLGVVGDEDDPKTSTLRCLGYFHEPEKSRFGLAFNIPRGYDSATAPLSLHSAISTLTKDARPTLGQRFGMAYGIGYALMEWFLVDWVHKSISSQNVFFFQKAAEQGMNEKSWDFSSPYLCGFEYARPVQEVSNEAFNHADFNTNIYRHPARHGLPSEGFGKRHDIYAFGVLLLEIGTWMVARDLFRDENHSPDSIRSTLIKNAQGRLGHFMGQKYRDATLFCLEGTLKVEGDDEKQTKLIAAFKEKILDIFEEGQRVL